MLENLPNTNATAHYKLTAKIRVQFAFTLILVFLSTIFQSWEIRDPRANHPLLRKLSQRLDKIGVDVVQNWKSNIKISSKPALAPLANYPVTVQPQRKQEEWIKEFNEGALGAITGIETTKTIQEENFFTQWQDAPEAKRVFISFACEDVEFAIKIKQIFAESGFVAFTYLNKANARPSQSPFQAGKYMGSAGIHLVLDTKTARQKKGVLAEALFHAKYFRTKKKNNPVIEKRGSNVSKYEDNKSDPNKKGPRPKLVRH